MQRYYSLTTNALRAAIQYRARQPHLTHIPARTITIAAGACTCSSTIHPPQPFSAVILTPPLPPAAPIRHFASSTSSPSSSNEQQYVASVSGSNYSSNALKHEQRIAELKAQLKAHKDGTASLNQKAAVGVAASFAFTELLVAVVSLGSFAAFIMYCIDPDDLTRTKEKTLAGIQDASSNRSATPSSSASTKQ